MYRVIPVLNASDCLCVATPHPSKLAAIDELRFILDRDLQVLQADEQQIDTFIRQLYPE